MQELDLGRFPESGWEFRAEVKRGFIELCKGLFSLTFHADHEIELVNLCPCLMEMKYLETLHLSIRDTSFTAADGRWQGLLAPCALHTLTLKHVHLQRSFVQMLSKSTTLNRLELLNCEDTGYLAKFPQLLSRISFIFVPDEQAIADLLSFDTFRPQTVRITRIDHTSSTWARFTCLDGIELLELGCVKAEHLQSGIPKVDVFRPILVSVGACPREKYEIVRIVASKAAIIEAEVAHYVAGTGGCEEMRYWESLKGYAENEEDQQA